MTQSNNNGASTVPGTPCREREFAAYDLLNEKEVAIVLGVAAGTLRNWRSLRAGPSYVKLGQRTVRYRWADVETFVATGSSRVEVRG